MKKLIFIFLLFPAIAFGQFKLPRLSSPAVVADTLKITGITNGQLLIGNTTGNTLTKATLTAGNNIAIINGAGSVTISTTSQFLRLTGSGTGAATTISIAHGLTGVTAASIAIVQPINAASAGIQYITCDATNINIVYSSAPVSGTNNLSYNIIIKP